MTLQPESQKASLISKVQVSVRPDRVEVAPECCAASDIRHSDKSGVPWRCSSDSNRT